MGGCDGPRAGAMRCDCEAYIGSLKCLLKFGDSEVAVHYRGVPAAVLRGLAWTGAPGVTREPAIRIGQ